ncbi:MAG: DUF4925 domain-containing protein [Tannerellaceae bacterium]|nr:DUF4925 domain-containing protein [Tannerellaceae bacterium]
MNNKLLLKCLTFLFLSGFFSACNDDKTDGITPEKATATYSNKLSTPENANRLTFTYSGHEMIGKDVYFETPDGSTASLTLSHIFPNQPETRLENIQLSQQVDGKGYSFSGNTTTTQGISMYYEGVLTEGALSLTLSGIQYPSNPLTQTGNWNVVHNADTESYREQDESGRYTTYYTYTKTAYSEIGVATGLLGIVNSMVLNPILSNIFSLTVNKVNFLPDGNVTISYASLPEEIPVAGMINNYITTERPASAWQTSPVNLATYYLEDDTVLYILPHIDMIIQQIRKASTKSDNILDKLDTQSLLALYTQLNKWSTQGIRLIARPNPYKEYVTATSVAKQRQAGDYLISIDKSEIREIFALMDLIPVLLPLFVDEQLLTTPLSYVIAGMGIEIPEEYQALVNALLGNMTLESLLTQIQEELIAGPFEIGIFINK